VDSAPEGAVMDKDPWIFFDLNIEPDWMSGETESDIEERERYHLQHLREEYDVDLSEDIDSTIQCIIRTKQE
jgi:hypothetical protein